MTKLRTYEIIDYLKETNDRLRKESRKPSFDDYAFPVEITAEYIAQVFNASVSTVYIKMKKLQDESIIISKRGDVRDKPGKRLIYFLSEDVDDLLHIQSWNV